MTKQSTLWTMLLVNLQDTDAWNNKATALNGLSKFDNALRYSEKGIELDLKFASV
jgi:hypothetical protein